jgi:hypothetical protein
MRMPENRMLRRTFGPCEILGSALKTETVCFSETFVSTYTSTRPRPEEQHRHPYEVHHIGLNREATFLNLSSASNMPTSLTFNASSYPTPLKPNANYIEGIMPEERIDIIS